MKTKILLMLEFLLPNILLLSAQGNFRDLDLNEWTGNDNAFFCNGTLTFRQSWQSFYYSFGKTISSGPGSTVEEIVIEFTEPVTFSDLNFWTAISHPSVDRTDHTIPEGTTSFRIELDNKGIGQLGFCYTGNISDIEYPSVKIKSVKVKMDVFLYEINGNEASISGCIVFTGDLKIPSSCTKDGKTYPITAIGDRAFYQYEDLNSITLPSSIKSIGNEAFQQCWFEEIIIPEGVETIGNEAFFYCRQLKSLSLPSTLKTIGRNAFGYCTSLQAVDIPGYTETIGNGAFCYDSNLKSVKLPSTLTTIPDMLFGGCSALNSLEIADGVESINYYAFGACTSLINVEIPASVTDMQGKVFSSSSSLETIDVKGAPYIIDNQNSEDTFANLPNGCTVYFPKECENKIHPSDYFKWEYIGLSGIEYIIADKRYPQGIYNLQGIKLAVKSIESLPNGIYIMNGKKIIKQ